MSQAADTITLIARAAAEAPARLAAIASYTPYVAHRIREALRGPDPEGLIDSTGVVCHDLHEVGGYFLSTSKFIDVEDTFGKRYRVTVEDVTASNEAPLTSAQRQIIRDALSAIGTADAKALAERFRERR